ncbi:MAG: hypothetical protein ACPH3N_00730 [Alcanivorax sediminis]|uniref:hypothetical protein n=1 Tax=Alcanivorax sediminis TaxID=2663008 RepID=UPI003C5B0BFC
MSVFSAAATIYGANKGADAMEDAIDASRLLQQEQQARAEKQFNPYAKVGRQSLGQYQANIGNQPNYQNVLANLVNDPGFQFRMQQGQNTLENSAAARGNLLSGATLKDLMGYSQGMASQEGANAYNREFNAFNNQQNQLANLMQQGFNASGQIVGSGQATTNNLANLAMAQGQNTANLWNTRAQAVGGLMDQLGAAIGGFGG